MSNFNIARKKGQVGETITWFVVTVIVVVILITFIYISSLMSKVKNIGIGDLKTDFGGKVIFTNKNNFAYMLTNNLNKDQIEKILSENEAK